MFAIYSLYRFGETRPGYPVDMERARVSWTDERLDDLSRRVDSGFNRVDADLRSIHSRIDAQSARMDDGFRSVNGRIDAQGARLDAFNQTMIRVGGGLTAAMLGMIVTFIATLG